MERKGFFDSLAQFVMLLSLIIAIVCTLGSFVCHFISPESKNLFLQLSFCAYGWMVFISVGPSALRSAFMKVDVLVNVLFPENVRKKLALICEILMAALVIAMFYFSLKVFQQTLAGGDKFAVAFDITEKIKRFGAPGGPALDAFAANAPRIPMWSAYLAAVIGFGLGIISYIIRVFKGGR